MTKPQQNILSRKKNLQGFLHYAKDRNIKFCDENANELTENKIPELLPFGLEVNPSSEENYLENCLNELEDNDIFICTSYQNSIKETSDLSSQPILSQLPFTVNSSNDTMNTTALEPTCSQAHCKNLIDTGMAAPQFSIDIFAENPIDFTRDM